MMFATFTQKLSDLKDSYQQLSRWKQVGVAIVALSVAYKLYKSIKPKPKKEEKKECYPNAVRLKATKLVNCNNKLGECCIWDNKNKLLCWIDNIGQRFFIYDPKTNETKHFDTNECPGSFALCEGNEYLFAFETGPRFYNLNTHKLSKKIFDFEPNSRTKMNDGRVDTNGRFIVGGMIKPYTNPNGNIITKWINTIRNIYLFVFSKGNKSNIYRINKDLTHQILVKDIMCSNSICFSLNGDTMYYTDTWGFMKDPKIMKMKYYNDKTLPSNPSIFTKECKGPDGSVIDSNGNIWNAQCGSYAVRCIDSKGNVVMVIDVPEKYPTCCCFGGDNLDVLYITTLNPNIFDVKEEGNFGSLYSVKIPNVKGCVENRFAGSSKQLQ